MKKNVIVMNLAHQPALLVQDGMEKNGIMMAQDPDAQHERYTYIFLPGNLVLVVSLGSHIL